MNESFITHSGQRAKVNCDRRCDKAWGINSRPKIFYSDDPDDYAFQADRPAGIAPIDPGTYEGGEGKPTSPDQFPSKWCVRECERCNMSEPGKSEEPLPIKTFDRRVYNQPWKHVDKVES